MSYLNAIQINCIAFLYNSKIFSLPFFNFSLRFYVHEFNNLVVSYEERDWEGCIYEEYN